MLRVRKIGFTLVELLVVVTIISILMALLLPSLRNSIEQARMVACMARQKQLYLAEMSYSNDNNDAITLFYSKGYVLRTSWLSLFPNYLGIQPAATLDGYVLRKGALSWENGVPVARYPGNEIVVCPSDPRTRVSHGYSSSSSLVSTYGQNPWLGWNNATVTSFEIGGYAHDHITRFGKIEKPVSILFWGENIGYAYPGSLGSDYNHVSSGTPTKLGLFHFGGENVVFADGHGKHYGPEIEVLLDSGMSSKAMSFWRACPTSIHNDISLITFTH